MAHSSTLTSLTEALVATLISTQYSNAINPRRAKDNFAKKLKYHNFGRTNQFEVAERLNGVEEKLQILSHDDLADALRARLVELRQHDTRWLPDILDLLLRLSRDPTTKSNLETLQTVKERAASPVPLKWSQVELDDPIDRNDPIWHIQEFSDLSSEEDDYDAESELAQSPQQTNETRQTPPASNTNPACVFLSVENESILTSKLENAQFWKSTEPEVDISEQQAVRECLFMLQGLPTSLFQHLSTAFVPSSRFQLRTLSRETLDQTLRDFSRTGDVAWYIRKWLEVPQKLKFMQSVRVSVQKVLANFDAAVSQLQATFVRPSHSSTVSLARVFDMMEEEARDVICMYNIALKITAAERSAVHPLDVLFDSICLAQFYDTKGFNTMINVFFDAFAIYIKPISTWMSAGYLDPNFDPFFVRAGVQANKSRIWDGWFLLDDRSISIRPPEFLKPFVPQMFACGKTVFFLRCLKTGPASEAAGDGFGLSLPDVRQSFQDQSMPFREIMINAISSAITASVTRASKLLQHEIGRTCALWATLEVLEHVYFAKSGHITESIDSKIFDRIDRCDNSWNDRFIVADLIDSNFSGLGGVEIDDLRVHSRAVSSRGMESRRQSVKILEDLSVEYMLSWPLANIISQSTLGSYRKVALVLMQIRRARHVILRKAHFFVHNGLLYIDAVDRKVAQALHYSLLLFVDIIYNHFTCLVIEQSAEQLKTQLKEAVDLEAMVSSFERHANLLEEACLTMKKLKVVHDAIISVLDMCIRFADVVSAPSGSKDADFEVRSFTSAHSRHGRRRHHTKEISSDDEEESDGGEGYSSFVVLEDTSPMDEIKRLKSQFERHLSFIVAGLRGMGKTGSQGTSWEVLAERLDWKKAPALPVF